MKDRFVEKVKALKENGSEKSEEGRFAEIKKVEKKLLKIYLLTIGKIRG